MSRIHISLDPREHLLVRKEAESLGISVSEFVRRAIREKLPIAHDRPWMRFAGLIESGDANSSAQIDEIVYGSR